METPVLALAFIALSLLMILLVLAGLKKVLPRTAFTAEKQKRIFSFTSVIIVAWLVLVSTLALKGVLADFSNMPPKMMLMIAPLGLLMISLTLFSRNLHEILRHTPPSWLLYIQSFRVAVEILLWAMFTRNLLPVQMTFEGWNFDIIAGLTGPLFAYLCFANGKMNRRLAIAWNIFGLLLLINIVSIAVLSLPAPFRAFMNEPSSAIVAQFPFVWLPAVLVPVAYTMHFFSLRQMLQQP
jgi:hypothetical protein